MLGQLNMNGLDRVEVAIKRIKAFEPPEGYYLAFSGGKDSVTIKALCDMAGVKYDAHYNVTSVDPPELVKFVKSFTDVRFDIPHDSDGKPITMWSLIPRNRMPPTRIMRYCCKALKEGGGESRFVITGVRWAESARRKNTRTSLEVGDGRRERLNADDPDNQESMMFRFCLTKHKRILNPIIDWQNEDVWEFIHKYNVKYCSLYDEGYTRLGCIGCPMGNAKGMNHDFERYPKYKKMYLKAFERMLDERSRAGLVSKRIGSTPEEVMNWWIHGKKIEEEADETD